MLKKKEGVQKQEKENKVGIKEKIKRFLKNKKAVAMLMEYIITIECFAMLFLLIAPEEVKAATSIADENGITWAYTLDENGNATNVYYENGTLGETVTIPSIVSDGTNEYPVVSLYNSSGSYRNIFTKTYNENNTTVKKVIIPEGVMSIGYYAFSKCSSLTSVEIPSSVSSIRGSAFKSCSSLTSIEIPSSVTRIENDAFSGCSSLTNVEIPSSVTSIEQGAFYSCSSLSSVEIPSSVTSIARNAFCRCSSLTSLTVDENNTKYSSENDILYNKNKTTLIYCAEGKEGEVIIPSRVTSIEWYAFSYCSRLTSVEIPNSVTSIGESAFYYCSSLTSVEIPNSVTSIEYEAFEYCSSLTSVEIPSSVTSISYYAFRGCSSLTSVEIPSSVRSIGDYAFAECVKLKRVNIPEGVTRIGKAIFWSCGSLTSVDIPSSVKSIEDVAFSGCRSLTSVEIPSSVTSIGGRVFEYCSSLTSVEIPNGVTSIGQSAFYYCSSLTSVIIPNSVTSIGNQAFWSCSSLTSVEIPSSVTSIGSSAFNGCRSLTSVEIPSSVTSIGNQAFWYCSSLTSVVIPSSVTSIGGRVFEGCRSLTSVEIPSSVMSIGACAFQQCSSLTSIEIPSSVTSIGQSAFCLCSNLTDIYIDNLQENITFGGSWKSATNAYEHYSDCKHEITKNIIEEGLQIEEVSNNLEEVQIACGETYSFKIVEGNGELATAIKVTVTSQGEFTNSAEVTEMIKPNKDGIYTIENIERNKTITVEKVVNGETLQAIDANGITWKYTYQEGQATNLYYESGELGETAEIPASLDGYPVVSLYNSSESGRNIFTKTSGGSNTTVKTVIIPEGVTSIGYMAFSSCSSLASVNIPSSVTIIEGLAFSNCSSLTRLTVDENNPNYSSENDILYNKDKTILIYCATGKKGEVIIPDSVTSIGSSAFSYCSSLTDIYIDNLRINVLFGSDWNYNTNAYVHYGDCSHTITTNIEVEGVQIEDISNNLKEGKVQCRDNYSFKVNIEEGSSLKGVIVKEGNVGAEKRIVKPDQNGCYTIENIGKDKEIRIAEGRIVIIRYEDKEGKQIARPSILVGEEGEGYKAERKEIANYRAYGEAPENEEGTFAKEEQVVIYKYEKIPSGTIRIKYQDTEGNDIIDPEEKQGYVGDEYEFARKNIRGYKAYGETPEKVKGTYTEEDMEIIFVYEEIKETETVIKYVDKDGNYIAKDKTVKEGEKAKLEEIEGYENVDKEEEGKEITYTYEKADKTGKENKWTTEKTLIGIAGVVVISTVMFVIIGKRQKEE